MAVRILVAANGPPDDPGTWSGSSAALLDALRGQGVEASGVDVRSSSLTRAEQLAAWSRDAQRWRQRFHANAARGAPAFREAATLVAGRRVRAAVDAVVQVGHWYDLARRRRAPVHASYSDANIAVQRGRADLRVGIGALRSAMRWEARTARRMDVVLAMSRWLADSFVEDYGVEAARVHVVGMGANVSPPQRVPERPSPEPVALFVGRSWERKGGPDLLRAWAAVRDAVPEAELVVAGPATPPAHLPAGVRFAGFVPRTDESRLRELYARATAFVMPSRYEPFGSAFLEAMGYGLPCIASATCAMPEIVADGVTGRLVAPGDHEALAAALAGLLTDPAAALRMGAAGRERLEQRFTWPLVAGRILSALGPR